MNDKPQSSLSTNLSFSSTTSPTMSEDDATVLMEDAISSPPRSQGKVRTSTCSSNLLFSDDNTSVFSHAPSSPSDRKISLSPSNSGEMKNQCNDMAKTPKSRRLFDDYEVSTSPSRAQASDHEETLEDLLQQFSPHQHPAYGGKARRYTLKPLDLNHTDLPTNGTSPQDIPEAPVIRRNSPHPQRTEVGRRKRGSPGRRRLDSSATPKTPYRTSNTLFPPAATSAPGRTDGPTMMHMSPRMSPNSFITMDGRFVQSKNPFSSPMMTDEDNLTPQTVPRRHIVRSPAPPFPVSFPTDAEDDDDGRHHARLPPRVRAGVALTSPLQNSGFPDQRFSFTGSPISELNTMNDHHSVLNHELHYGNTAMETDTASSGSLHKVRRLSREDDVVAATGQHLRSMNPYPPRRTMNVNTSFDKNPWEDHDDVSPTDVASFPPPPTPSKSRREPPPPPYARIRAEPATPVRPSRQVAPSSRTPHPEKSRFTSDFDVIGELGKGSFGQVYKVLSRLDGCMYAIKAGHRPAKGQSDRDRMLKEVYALAALSDQADTATFHIVRYHQAWMEEDRLYIQTELCTGTLSDEVARTGRPTEFRRYKLMREMLLALDFIHRNNMVHLDIKPDNIFLKNDQYKLGDFGLVTQSSASQDVEEGDSRYMSLELLQGDRSDLTKSDIFSLGITLYEICKFGGNQGLPMNGDDWQNLRAGRIETPLPKTGHEMSILIQRMMNPSPPLRPAASDLLKHPQLLSEDQKALNKERSRVAQANMQLAARQFDRPPTRKRLVRANTWNGNLSLM